MLLNHLSRYPNDFAGALRNIPKKLRIMFVHAYQAYIWNLVVQKIDKSCDIPLIGYETEIDEYENVKVIKKILESEGISHSDFKIRSMPELSSSGSSRSSHVKTTIKLKSIKDNKCIELEFFLPKGSYATIVVKALEDNK